MAIKKEDAEISAGREQLRKKKGEGLIRPRRDLLDKSGRRDHEAGVDPQDEQLNPMPEEQQIRPGQSVSGD